MIRGFLFIAIVASSLLAGDVDYLSQFRTLAKAAYSGDYRREYSLFSKSPSFTSFAILMKQRKTYSYGQGEKKRSVDSLDYASLFPVLKTLSSESSSSIPAFYAFLMTRLSYGYKNTGFNTKYGDFFATRLSQAKRCEGYFWKGEMAQNRKSTWKDSVLSYAKAIKSCKNGTFYYRQSRTGYAKMKYLVSKKGSK